MNIALHQYIKPIANGNIQDRGKSQNQPARKRQVITMGKQFIRAVTLALLPLLLIFYTCTPPKNQIVAKPNSRTSTAAIDEKTREVLNIFEQISAIPRCSEREKKVSKWLVNWAQKHGFKVSADKIGNVVIKVPATNGYETAPKVIFQGHMDMVCDKTPETNHDFRKDPVRLIYEGDWLKADNTTLGADNGLGMAVCLALAKDKTVNHPPLEILFTVQEESGLIGAKSLDPGFVEGKTLLNIDSEEEGVFTIGSAGGILTLIYLPVTTHIPAKDQTVYRLRIDGLQGGHSGLDINKKRGNANKILARTLEALNTSSQISLISVKGGTKANAIPREAEAIFTCDPTQFLNLKKLIAHREQTLRNEFAHTDTSPSIHFSQMKSKDFTGSVFIRQDTDRVISLLLALPDGVAEMSADIEGRVETSNNIGIVGLKNTSLFAISLQRGAKKSNLQEISKRIEAIASQFGGKTKKLGEFPAWEPNTRSRLLKRCKTVYGKVFEKEPRVTIVHGGLECSVIGSKFDDMDMISLGPTIKDSHSPDEKVYIPSIDRVWRFLAAFLTSYGN
jgi:dipeptidase D